MKNKITFEDYLKDEHSKTYTGTDDDMPDNFEAWLERLDKNELMELAEKLVTILSDRLYNSLQIGAEAISELTKIKAIEKSILKELNKNE